MNTTQQILALIDTKNNWNTTLLKEEILKILAADPQTRSQENKIEAAFRDHNATYNKAAIENYGKLPDSINLDFTT